LESLENIHYRAIQGMDQTLMAALSNCS